MKILGIDEAGRGPLIGPLIIAGVLVEESKLKKLSSWSTLDSKKIPRLRREEIFLSLKSLIDDLEIVKISPSKIDSHSLNLLEIESTSYIINKLKPHKVYIDAPTHPRGIFSYHQHLKRKIFSPHVELIIENKADAKFKIVGLASIIAKVIRDKYILKLRKEYGDFGWGYPSEVKTKKFLKQYFKKYKEVPSFVRKKWKTVQKILNEK